MKIKKAHVIGATIGIGIYVTIVLLFDYFNT